MEEFALEVFSPGNRAATEAARLAELARRLRQEGDHVRYLHTLHLTPDETDFHVFEAASLEVMQRLEARAGLGRARVVPVASHPETR
jgi:hypothetical protein